MTRSPGPTSTHFATGFRRNTLLYKWCARPDAQIQNHVAKKQITRHYGKRPHAASLAVMHIKIRYKWISKRCRVHHNQLTERFDAVLGLSFLKHHNPTISWTAGSLTFSDGHIVTCPIEPRSSSNNVDVIRSSRAMIPLWPAKYLKWSGHRIFAQCFANMTQRKALLLYYPLVPILSL